MSIDAPLTIYVDEAGSPVFRGVNPGENPKAYIPCAVAVPVLAEFNFERLLPRSPLGAFLKSSDQAFSGSIAKNFVIDLLRSEADVAAILIDPSTPQSVTAAHNTTDLSNMRRQSVHHRKIKVAGLTYSLFLAKLVTNVLLVHLSRTRSPISFFNVICDDTCLSPQHAEHFRDSLIKAAEESNMKIGKLEWASNDREPLLNLPDLVAGIFHRHATYGDAKDACGLLLQAGKKGRISIQDGHTIGNHKQRPPNSFLI